MRDIFYCYGSRWGETIMVILYALFGLLGGVLGGMGMGGGTLTIPLLTIFAGVSQNYAQAYNLVSFIPTAIVALIIHAKQKLVKWNKILWIIVPAILSSVFGSILALSINTDSLRVGFGIFLIVLGIIFFILGVVIPKNKKQ